MLQRRLLARRGFVTITGRGRGALRLPLPRVATGIAAGLVLLWVALAITVYAMIFAGGFFEKRGLNHALTLRHYVTAFGLLIAYLFSRQQFAGKDAFEFVTMLSFAMPGTVVGIGYMLAARVQCAATRARLFRDHSTEDFRNE